MPCRLQRSGLNRLQPVTLNTAAWTLHRPPHLF